MDGVRGVMVLALAVFFEKKHPPGGGSISVGLLCLSVALFCLSVSVR